MHLAVDHDMVLDKRPDLLYFYKPNLPLAPRTPQDTPTTARTLTPIPPPAPFRHAQGLDHDSYDVDGQDEGEMPEIPVRLIASQANAVNMQVRNKIDGTCTDYIVEGVPWSTTYRNNLAPHVTDPDRKITYGDEECSPDYHLPTLLAMSTLWPLVIIFHVESRTYPTLYYTDDDDDDDDMDDADDDENNSDYPDSDSDRSSDGASDEPPPSPPPDSQPPSPPPFPP